MLTTPVAMFVFNRPDLTNRVFAEVARARPRRLFVVADGARNNVAGEAERCAAARAIVQTVNWPCEIQTDFSDVNLGCKMRVSTGITWVFEQCDEAIILEDDCLPHPSFFPFAQEMLRRYRDEPRVMHISGANFQGGLKRTSDSYYFSRYAHVWGWATWRSAWRRYDVNAAIWPSFSREGLGRVCRSAGERQFWREVFQRVHAGAIDTWDYQWVLAIWAASGVAITPAVNLVSNLGFRRDATHTVTRSEMADLPPGDIGPVASLRHPKAIRLCNPADSFTSRQVFGISERLIRHRIMAWSAAILKRLRNSLRSLRFRRRARGCS